MNQLKSYRWEIGLILLYTIGVVGYFTFIRTLIPDLFSNTAPAWLQEFVHTFYPRFEVEKHRFDLPFFIGKADQLMFRSGFIAFIAVSFSIAIKKSQRLQVATAHFWNRKSTLQSISALRKVYACVMLAYIFDWYIDLMLLSKLNVFYEPILLFKLFHIPLFPPLAMRIAVGTYVLSLMMLLLGRWTWQFSIINSILFVLFQGYFQCFGKVAHTFTPFIYAACFIPFLFFEEAKARKNKQSTVQNWGLLLIQFAIAFGYLFSGLEKVFISQLAWFKPDTVIAYIQLNQAPLGLWLIQFELLCHLLPIGALFFQFGFISILFKPQLKKLFLPMGLCFHWGTFLLLGVGWWIHPWQVAYLFFIDWNWLREKFMTAE